MSDVRQRKPTKDDIKKKVGSSKKNDDQSTLSNLKTPLIFLALGLTAIYLSPYKIQFVAKESAPVSTEEGLFSFFSTEK